MLSLCYRACVGSNTRPQVSAFLSDWSGNCWSFHFTFVVHNYSCIVLEVNEDSITSAERFTLSNDNCGHDLKNEKLELRLWICHFQWAHLFSQLWFTLLHGSDEHVTNSGSWQTIQTTTDTHDCDNVQVLTTLKNNQDKSRDPVKVFVWNYQCYQRNSWQRRLGKQGRCGTFLRRIHHDL